MLSPGRLQLMNSPIGLSLADRRLFVIIYRDDAFARISARHFSRGVFAGGG
jgi:hypothetical protein